MLDKIMAINFKGFIKALISIEKEIEDERILNQVYDRFMDRYYISLINDYFDEIIQELAEENTIEDDWDLEL